MSPSYDLDKIKFGTDAPTFEKAVDLYEAGKVTDFKEDSFSFSAVVLGTKPYQVRVGIQHYDAASCQCYVGQKETLCKHMVAVAIRAVTAGKPLSVEDKQQFLEPTCSGKLGSPSDEELTEIKKSISGAVRYIKPYVGPSRIWFSYQNSLNEGCNRLSKIISELPVSDRSAKLLVDLLIQLDEKLCRGGVDDSDGTVGGFMSETVRVLQEYTSFDPICVKLFYKLKDRETSFGWEEPLLELCEGNL